jgi:hypothetical protein
MKTIVTIKNGSKEKTMKISTENGRVYMDSTFYYELIPGDFSGVETLRTKLSQGTTITERNEELFWAGKPIESLI